MTSRGALFNALSGSYSIAAVRTGATGDCCKVWCSSGHSHICLVSWKQMGACCSLDLSLSQPQPGQHVGRGVNGFHKLFHLCPMHPQNLGGMGVFMRMSCCTTLMPLKRKQRTSCCLPACPKALESVRECLTSCLQLIDLGACADLRSGTNYAPDETILDPHFAPPEQVCMYVSAFWCGFNLHSQAQTQH